MLKRIQTLEDGRVPAKEAKNWKIEGQRTELLGRNTENCPMSLIWAIHGTKRSMESRQREHVARQSCIAKGRRRQCQRIQGDARRELPEQLVEGGGGRQGTISLTETKEEVSKNRKRDGEKGEDETVAVKRRCVNLVSAEAWGGFGEL